MSEKGHLLGTGNPFKNRCFDILIVAFFLHFQGKERLKHRDHLCHHTIPSADLEFRKKKNYDMTDYYFKQILAFPHRSEVR